MARSCSRDRRFCAVGVQSPALWLSAGETAPGPFDDAEDYERNDVLALRAPIHFGSTSARAIRSATPRSRTRGGPALTPTFRPADTTRLSGTRTCRSSYASSRMPAPDPKIELHVHLEGTVRPDTLRAIARRNDYALPDNLESHYRFRDFAHFIEVWILTTNALRVAEDFRQVVTEYAAEAASHGAVYLEGIFSPAERVARGVDWDEIFSGYCDGAEEARELHGVEVRLTPDIFRGATSEQAEQVVRYSAKYRDRGVVAVGLGGMEAEYPPEPYAAAFSLAGSLGLGSAPHAGEAAGAVSVRGALESLGADRIRHGVRAVEDPGLVGELAGRGTVLDVCPLSNLRTGAVRSLEEHPLPQLVAAGVRCSISTDDPAMFDTDLTRDYKAAAQLGVSPRDAFEAGLAGALCDEPTRAKLQRIGDSHDWAGLEATPAKPASPRPEDPAPDSAAGR
jgi:aminodeoxyfutalosine deaminase